jgi:hypothetical protein
VNCVVRASSAPSNASLNIRPMAFNGFESESPVRWRNRRASMLGRESGVADSSPACNEEGGEAVVGIGTGMGWAGGRLGVTEFGLTEGEDEREEDEDDWRGGDCDREIASAWTAFSTFLKLLFHAMKK